MTSNNGIKVVHAARFLKSLKRLPWRIQEKIAERHDIFTQNPFDPRLDTHKLHGRFKEFWAYSVDHRYRVIFIFKNPHTVIYYDTGLHPIYRGSE